jgi:hypothetical protein
MTLRAEEDGWIPDGPNILSPESLSVVRDRLERSPVIVEHRHYRAGRSPRRLVFDDFEDFDEYIRNEARPGDSFWLWDYESLCRDDNPITQGKYPDSDGYVPEKGAY